MNQPARRKDERQVPAVPKTVRLFYAHEIIAQDENAELLETLVRCGAQTMDMETHQLLHLASRRVELMKAAAVHIGVISRTNDHFMHPITVRARNGTICDYFSRALTTFLALFFSNPASFAP